MYNDVIRMIKIAQRGMVGMTYIRTKFLYSIEVNWVFN